MNFIRIMFLICCAVIAVNYFALRTKRITEEDFTTAVFGQVLTFIAVIILVCLGY